MHILSFAKDSLKYHQLTNQLIKRDVAGRYRGSQLGLAWTVINPLLMLSVYTLVFSQVFKARWGAGTGPQNPLEFALNLFAGLLVFNFFAECANRSPTIITNNPNYVKKIVFPLHVLGTTIVGSALVHGLTSTAILITAKLIIDGRVPITLLLLPLVWTPLVLGTLGMSWLLSTAGVFLRDIGQLTGALVSMLMFLSPIFYPASALPQGLQWLASLNPLATSIEQTRGILISGQAPDPAQWVTQILLSLVWCEFCFRILQKAKPNFGDML